MEIQNDPKLVFKTAGFCVPAAEGTTTITDHDDDIEPNDVELETVVEWKNY